jgi:hypothetical protein
MVETSGTLAGLAVLFWATFLATVVALLRIALRPDAGYGAVGRGKFWRSRIPPRTGVTPVAIPPRHVSPQGRA